LLSGDTQSNPCWEKNRMPPKSPNAGYQEIAPTHWSTALMGRSQAINANHSGN